MSGGVASLAARRYRAAVAPPGSVPALLAAVRADVGRGLPRRSVLDALEDLRRALREEGQAAEAAVLEAMDVLEVADFAAEAV